MAMSEMEIRLLAAEIVATELTAWIDADKIADAVASIKAGMLADICEDEREARAAAIQLLTDGKNRFVVGTVGGWIRSGER